MSYNYFLCFQESRFWPCPCEVKLRDKDSFVWGKSAISTDILKQGILPVCPWVSRGHPQWLSIQGTNQLFGHLHCLESRAKEDQKGFEGFHSRMFVCVSKEGHQMSACLKEPGLSCSSPQMMSLMSFCVWLIWPHGDRTSWDTWGGHCPKSRSAALSPAVSGKAVFPFHAVWSEMLFSVVHKG